MNITVLGMGYVGVVTSACLAKEDHTIYGVDISEQKINILKEGKSPIIEDGINQLVADSVATGAFIPCMDIGFALSASDAVIVCVGTPSMEGGALCSDFVRNACEDIGKYLLESEKSLEIVIRSTLTPGTMREIVIPTIEKVSGKTIGKGFNVYFHPEFLREGTSVFDFYNPPKIVVGVRDSNSAEVVLDWYSKEIEAPRIVCTLEEAEMVKYCDNMFHAVKVTFANEIGHFCKKAGIDGRKVMEIFIQDRKLNISDKYLRPGCAFGGSCLPKDLRAFVHSARSRNLDLKMLENVLLSNKWQIDRLVDEILNLKARKIGFYGLAFKKGTDDLRESPYVEIAERLVGKGRTIKVYDEFVNISKLIGRNSSFIVDKLPHISEMMVESPSELKNVDLLVLCHSVNDDQLREISTKGVEIVDLTSI